MPGSKKGIIYLDHNATAPLLPEVLDAMLPFLAGPPSNASSRCRPGRAAANAIAAARDQVAALIGCDPPEVIFTSGGTESVHTAIRSALALQPERRHIVASAVEHSAVRNLLRTLADLQHEVTWVPVDFAGDIDPAAFAAALRPDTALATVLFANNETGVLSPVARLADLAAERGIPFHTDAVQAAGKHPVDLSATRIASASLAAHKFGGPQGVGALFVSRRLKFVPQTVGGGQENGRRAGTENVAGIVGLGTACRLASGRLPEFVRRVGQLRDDLERRLFAEIPDLRRNGRTDGRLANTSNLCIPSIPAETLLILLDQAGVCCSAGSACTTGSPAPSHVLKAMGLTDAEAKSSLRFSLGQTTTPADIASATEQILKAVDKARFVV
jgi:cysteine desulfurase